MSSLVVLDGLRIGLYTLCNSKKKNRFDKEKSLDANPFNHFSYLLVDIWLFSGSNTGETLTKGLSSESEL